MLLESSADVAGALARVELDLRLAVALKRNAKLRLGVLRGRKVLVVVLPLRTGWMRLEPRALSITRECPVDADGATAFADLAADPLLSSQGSGAKTIEAAHDVARGLVTNLFLDPVWNYRGISEWAPLVEASIYVVATRATAALDKMRRTVLDACNSGRPEANTLTFGYRRMVDGLARATLLSTDAGSPWLADMAKSFDWKIWTPSLPLSRERDIWAAMLSARAASRFGPTLIERYFAALHAAPHPLYAIEALVGLTAIALRAPSERESLARHLELEQGRLSRRVFGSLDLVANAYAEALCALAGEPRTALTIPTARFDAFNAARDGRIPIFDHIKLAVESPAGALAGAGQATEPDASREMFLRAWGVGHTDLNSYPDSAFGRA